MTEAKLILLRTWVAETESPAVRKAADLISKALNQATQEAWRCEVAPCARRDDLFRGTKATVLLTSLLPELAQVEEPWATQEVELRSHFAAITEQGSPVFICTVLRSVRSLEEGVKYQMLERIRQLNLLVTEVSRETGAYVVDVDRAIAHLGAAPLGTDYRLGGPAAADTAGHFMALTVMENGLDGTVPFEVQDAARALLETWKPAMKHLDADQPEVTLRKNLMVMGQGRLKQTVAPISYTVQKSYADWLVRQVMRGSFSRVEILQKFMAAVRRRGLRESTVLLLSGLAGQLKRKK